MGWEGEGGLTPTPQTHCLDCSSFFLNGKPNCRSELRLATKIRFYSLSCCDLIASYNLPLGWLGFGLEWDVGFPLSDVLDDQQPSWQLGDLLRYASKIQLERMSPLFRVYEHVRSQTLGSVGKRKAC